MMVATHAPPELRGKWKGYNVGAQTFGQVVAPLALSSVYDSFRDSEDGTLASLLLCASVSTLAFLIYLRLRAFYPRASGVVPSATLRADADTYEAMSGRQFARLPREERMAAVRLLTDAGRSPPLERWGRYDEDLEELPTIMREAHDGLESTRNYLTRSLSSEAPLLEMLEVEKRTRRQVGSTCDLEKEAHHMGTWLRAYLEDAGYPMWAFEPAIFKACLMNAFPPVEKLDGQQLDVTADVRTFETHFLKLFAVLDKHAHDWKVQQRAMELEGLGLGAEAHSRSCEGFVGSLTNLLRFTL